ncbi:MAG: tyrosine-type recombinase/integrase [Actinomycetota bacterium]
MGYVVERAGHFYAVCYDGVDPITGRERRRWHAAGTARSDAEAVAAILTSERSALAGTGSSASATTLVVYLRRSWLPAKRMTVKATTWQRYAWMIEHYVAPTIGAVPLRGLRADHLERLYEQLLAPKEHGGRALASKTVLGVHSVIRSALAAACRQRLVTINVADMAHAPKVRAITRPPMRSWTADQLASFLVAAANQRLFPALYLAAMTGMRRGEVLGLRWCDVDLDARRLFVNRALHLVGTRPIESAVKTGHSRRSIDLDETTVSALHEWKSRQHDAPAPAGPDDWVFSARGGGPVNPDLLTQTFDRIVARSGLTRIRLHDLRHTHASLLLKAGVPLKVVSERLGHASPAFTMVTYQHVLPGMQADAARCFAELVRAATDAGRQNR